MFSLLFLQSAARDVLIFLSSSSHRPRGAVPFMGLVVIVAACREKKSSGEKERIV
jgi:hypothetical protein